MLLTFTWQWLRDGQDAKGLARLDELMFNAVDPDTARRERARRNHELMTANKREAVAEEEKITDEDWTELVDDEGMVGIEWEG